MNGQQAQQLQTVISIVLGLAFVALVIADVIKAFKGALKG